MLRLSIVLIGRNLEPLIRAAASSVLRQIESHEDIELIFIDNGSTDGTVAAVEEEAACYPSATIRIVRLDTNEGPGEARNRGLELARGDYIAFLDGDDYFHDHAIERLRSVALDAQVDVFVYNHARVYEDGRIVANLRTDRLPDGEAHSLDARRLLIPNLNVVWNKLYSRAFLTRHNMRFRRGIYEDIEWNYRALLLAESVAVTRDILVYYRQWSGSTLRTECTSHFDVFEQWKAVLSFLESEPALLSSYGAEVEAYALRQVEGSFYTQGRIPRAHRAEYFNRMSELWREFDRLLYADPRRELRIMDRWIRWRMPRLYEWTKELAVASSRMRGRLNARRGYDAGQIAASQSGLAR